MRSMPRLPASTSLLQGGGTGTSVSLGQDMFSRAEYEEKCMALMSVQRNYETMSRMMQMRQQEFQELNKRYENECARAVSLSVQLDDALGRAMRAEATATKLAGMQEAYQTLQAEHQKLKYEASLQAGMATAASEKLASLQKAAEEAEFKASTIARERDAWRNSEAAKKAEHDKLLQELEAVRAEAKALAVDLQNTREQVYKAQEVNREAERHADTLAARVLSRDEQISALQETIRSLQDTLHEAQSSIRASQVALETCKSQQAVADGAARTLGRALELAGEERRLAVARATKLEEKLVLAHESAAAFEQRVVQLTGLLAEAEDKYQASLVQGSEAGEGLTRLQVQLASNKALLSGTRQQMAEMERAHMGALQTAQAAAADAEARLAEQTSRNARTRHMYAEFLQALVSRVEKAIASVSSFQSSFGSALGEVAERQQRAMAALGYRMQVWEAQTGDAAERITHLGAMIRQMASELATCKLSQAKSVAAEGVNAQTLKDRVAVLEGLLAVEQAAKAAAVQSKNKAEEAHAEALTSLRTAADERVDAERQRLGLRLSQVEAEVARLRVTCEEDRAAAARVLELERAQMIRSIQAAAAREAELLQEIESLKDQALNANRHELAILNRKFVEETAMAKSAHQAQVGQLEGTIQRQRNSLSSAQSTCQQVLAEMGVVVSHLARMGWEVHSIQLGAANDVLCQPDQDGSHAAKLASLVRLHFSYVTEAVQNMAKKPAPPVAPAPEKQNDWSSVAKELKSTIAQLLHVEESLATNCTCMLCLDVLKKPSTCVPCGHTYCQSCFNAHGQLCVECGDRPVARVVTSTALDAICCKYEYKLSALRSLQKHMSGA